jgi:hypothetical protein
MLDASLFVTDIDLHEASRALCELTARCEANGVWDWVADDLHIPALRLLRTSGALLTAEQRESVVAGLRKVTPKRLGDPVAEEAQRAWDEAVPEG